VAKFLNAKGLARDVLTGVTVRHYQYDEKEHRKYEQIKREHEDNAQDDGWNIGVVGIHHDATGDRLYWMLYKSKVDIYETCDIDEFQKVFKAERWRGIKKYVRQFGVACEPGQPSNVTEKHEELPA